MCVMGYQICFGVAADAVSAKRSRIISGGDICARSGIPLAAVECLLPPRQTEMNLSPRTWVKLYTHGWLHGSIRRESVLVRSVFLDLLALAGASGEGGTISIIGNGVGYTDMQIAQLFCISEEDWKYAKRNLSTATGGEENRIEVVDNNVIKIINWNKYQSDYDKRRDKHRNVPTLHGHIDLEVDLDLDLKKTNIYSVNFQKFWTVYPRCIGKGLAHDAFNRVTKNYTANDIITAAIEYAKTCERERREERYILHPATFLNKDRWKDYCLLEDSDAK